MLIHPTTCCSEEDEASDFDDNHDNEFVYNDVANSDFYPREM